MVKADDPIECCVGGNWIECDKGTARCDPGADESEIIFCIGCAQGILIKPFLLKMILE